MILSPKLSFFVCVSTNLLRRTGLTRELPRIAACMHSVLRLGRPLSTSIAAMLCICHFESRFLTAMELEQSFGKGETYICLDIETSRHSIRATHD